MDRLLLCSCLALAGCGRIGFAPLPASLPGPTASQVCSSDDALDSDGDGRCDADDMCPGSDDDADADGDGIPDGCDACGDGRVDVAQGETCDPGSALMSCVATCDDGDPCTEDRLLGSADKCDASCLHVAITEPSNGDGCCPAGGDHTNDADCPPICGNGAVETGETCEAGAGAGARCPTDCDDGDDCTLDERRGDAEHCDVVCSHEPVMIFVDGDGCCPAGGDSNMDSDCNPLCGNGSIDAMETCDPGSAATQCPAGCDDGDPCTRDTASGAAQTCNAVCSNEPITMPFNEDGCCPAGANSTNDLDCAPICGNGVIEAGEQCDGGAGCNACTLTLEGQCRARLGDDACSQCGCSACATQMMNCYASGDSVRDQRCPPVVECAIEQQCVGTCASPYYCFGLHCWAGNGGFNAPNGPCKVEISAAANGATTTAQVGPRSQDPAYPLNWSEQYVTCLRAQCRSQCNL